jgi:hypothetical protein
MFKYGEIVKVRNGEDYGIAFPWSAAVEWPKHGDKLVVVSADYCTCRVEKPDGYDIVVHTTSLESTGQMMDFGKHPFKEFYENGITPDDLPPHSLKNRVLLFLRGHCGRATKHPYDMTFFWPNVDVFETDFLYIWPNANARKKGKAGRTQIKPGKFFRMLYKDITDQEVESLVNTFKEQFKPIEVEVFSGDSIENILHAYTHDRSVDRHFETSGDYKRLCDSCMRYDNDYFETSVHPVEAYNTGDWGIFWAEDDKGLIAARCLYYKKGEKKELGPIYATSQEAIDALKKEIAKHNCSKVNEGYWGGARILKIEEDGAFVGPYFDCHSTLREEGKYLILDRDGEIEHDHMGKYCRDDRPTCHDCGERFESYELSYVESVDGDVCNHCLESDYFFSDFSEQYFRHGDEEDTEVYVTQSRNETWTKAEAEANAYWVDCESEYYQEHLVWETEDGYIPKSYLDDGSWAICSVDNLAYNIEEMIDTKDGLVAKCNVDEDMLEGKVA